MSWLTRVHAVVSSPSFRMLVLLPILEALYKSWGRPFYVSSKRFPLIIGRVGSLTLPFQCIPSLPYPVLGPSYKSVSCVRRVLRGWILVSLVPSGQLCYGVRWEQGAFHRRVL
jgi:hypothetical protein